MIELEVIMTLASNNLIDYDSHASAWESSKLNQKKYCNAHNLNYGHFVAARSRLQAKRGKTRQVATQKFIPLKTQPVSTASETPHVPNASSAIICLRLVNGTELELPTTLSKDQYHTLFHSLQALL